MTWFSWTMRVLGMAVAVAGCGDDSGTGSASDGTASGESGSASGTGADPLIHECTPEQGNFPTDPETRTGVDGTNGEFIDRCDDDGNLLDYMCNLECLEFDAGPNPVCIRFGPGEATEIFYDCGGNCSGGTCDARCPTHGHRLEIQSIQGAAYEFENLEDGRRYACDRVADLPGGSLDCAADLSVGDVVEITTLGLSGPCTGPVGSFGIGDPQACTFSCRIAG